MPFLCFKWRVGGGGSGDDDQGRLSLDASERREHRVAAVVEPPAPDCNLFEPFPRVMFGGYRRFYQGRSLEQQILNTSVAMSFTSRGSDESTGSSETSFGSIQEDPWSWQSLPAFTGKKTPSQRHRRRTSSIGSLRTKPRSIHLSISSLVDEKDDSWPDWLRSDSRSMSSCANHDA